MTLLTSVLGSSRITSSLETLNILDCVVHALCFRVSGTCGPAAASFASIIREFAGSEKAFHDSDRIALANAVAYNKDEFPPLLSEGLHHMSLQEIENLCVARFPHSTTRKNIMAGLHAVLTRIAAVGITGDVWVNGSFLTESIDPNDSDIVVMIPAYFYDNGTPEQKSVIDWLIDSADEPKKLHKCDAYVHLRYESGSPEEQLWKPTLDRWRQLYGLGPVSGKPKGIAVLSLSGVLQ